MPGTVLSTRARTIHGDYNGDWLERLEIEEDSEFIGNNSKYYCLQARMMLENTSTEKCNGKSAGQSASDGQSRP